MNWHCLIFHYLVYFFWGGGEFGIALPLEVVAIEHYFCLVKLLKIVKLHPKRSFILILLYCDPDELEIKLL